LHSRSNDFKTYCLPGAGADCDHPEIAKTDYNLACVRAAVGDREEALKLLHQAVDHGLDNLDMALIGEDPDLNGLHGDPRFSELAAQAKSRAAAASGAK
jgi:hypothetical protein